MNITVSLMLLLVMQVKLGEAEEKIQLAVPGHSLESALDQLGQLAATFNSESRTNLPSALRWNKSFDEIRIPVAAFWDHLELKARELANLKPGDVLPMDRQALEQVRLRLGNLPKFEGRLGTTSGKWAIALTGLVKLEP